MRRTLYVLLLGLIGLAVRSGRSKDLEIIVLRHQLTVLRRQVDRPLITDEDRSLLGAVAQALSRQARAGWIITPDTLLRWHRRRVARHWTHPPRRRGRPATSAAIQRLVVEMAVDNPTWGYRRIHGELVGLGHRLAASTVWQILKDQRVGPAPQRASVTWSDFLRSQAAVACDFACVDTVGLRRYYLLFFIDIETRRVFYAGITAHPTGDWTTQAARNLFLRHGEALAGCRALVRDRGAQFTASFDEIFRSEGIKVLRTPVRTPVANAFAERWIGTLRRELLDRTLVWNQSQLERIVTDYNEHRPHRSLNQRPPSQAPAPPIRSPADQSHLHRTSRCDGLIHEYRNAA